MLTTRPMSPQRRAALALAVLTLTVGCSSASPPSAVSTPTPARTADITPTATTPPTTSTPPPAAPTVPTATASTAASPPTSTPTSRPATPSSSRNPIVIITPPSASTLDLAALNTVKEYPLKEDSALASRSTAQFEQLFSQKCAKCLRDLALLRSRIQKGWYFVNLNGTNGPKNVVVSIDSSSSTKATVKLEVADQPNKLVDRAGKAIGVNKTEHYYLYYADVVRDGSGRTVISALTLVDLA